MDAVTVGAIATAAVTVIIAILKMHSEIVKTVIPREVDRVIKAIRDQSKVQRGQHAATQKSVHDVESDVGELQTKNGIKKPAQDAPSRRSEARKRVKSRPKKPAKKK